MKKVLILHTGGTIGMMPTEKGYAPVKGYFEKALEDIPFGFLQHDGRRME